MTAYITAADSSVAGDDALVHREDGILAATINRPDQRNAVTPRRLRFPLTCLTPPALLACVLHGNGPACCAGRDLTAFAAGKQVRDPFRGFAGIVERL